MLSAVIAKLQITSSRSFGSGCLTVLNCICENDLMAAYAESEEDRLFTKYSPWGEAHLGACLATGVEISSLDGRRFYVVTVNGQQPCRGAAKVVACRVVAITDFGDNQAKRVEVASEYAEKTALNWKMSIDNPPAVAFFEPGKGGYRVAFYDADEFTRDTALADALTDA
jgi:hypothetical protein